MSRFVAEIADLLPALVACRHDLHAHPELAYAEHRTAGIVADTLREIGCEVTTGVGGTGVVGVLVNGSSDRRIALRADMDALPMEEATGLRYRSRNVGIFHGCGHDGHTTMLLGAARHLARTRHFDGSVAFVFQPAEEGQAGAKAMVEAGLFERFPADRVFALHNWPGLPLGHAATRPGPIMAAADRFEVRISGRGGHAAEPHLASQVLGAASRIVLAFDAVPSRRLAPTEKAVLSVTKMSGGTAHNVLPSQATIVGTVRSFSEAVQDRIEAVMRTVAAGIAAETETTIELDYLRYYPATINDPEAAEIALAAARRVGLVAETAAEAAFTSEDFAYMLQARPGAYLWLGQGGGANRAPLHHPAYDFVDDVIGHGVGWFTALVEDRTSAQAAE